MSREKTDSITHLVKIVAREVVNERLKEVAIDHLNTHIKNAKKVDTLEKQVKKLFAMVTSLNKADKQPSKPIKDYCPSCGANHLEQAKDLKREWLGYTYLCSACGSTFHIKFRSRKGYLNV